MNYEFVAFQIIYPMKQIILMQRYVCTAHSPSLLSVGVTSKALGNIDIDANRNFFSAHIQVLNLNKHINWLDKILNWHLQTPKPDMSNFNFAKINFGIERKSPFKIKFKVFQMVQQ